ncbi:hypothetical protein AAC387_Pa12g1798 [Persea americana]
MQALKSQIRQWAISLMMVSSSDVAPTWTAKKWSLGMAQLAIDKQISTVQLHWAIPSTPGDGYFQMRTAQHDPPHPGIRRAQKVPRGKVGHLEKEEEEEEEEEELMKKGVGGDW